MFSLTSAAAQQIQLAAQASNAQHMALRLAAKLDSDGGLQYGMGFDEPEDDDLKLHLEGVSIVIGAEHQSLLEDTTLDFVELDPGDFNFIFVDGRQTRGPSSGGCSSGGCTGGGCASKGGGCH
jgi:iron-sulfur cluster assembly protein